MSVQPTLASALASVTDLMELIDEYADARHRCGDGSYNTTTAAARKAVVVALSAQVLASYSLDADPLGIRAQVADAINGALALGAQNSKPPPEGHWLGVFWNIARDERVAADAREYASRPGFVSVPMRLTRAMDKVMQQDDWQWEDLLLAAKVVDEDDYLAVSRDEPSAAEILASFLRYGVAAGPSHLKAVREMFSNAPAKVPAALGSLQAASA